MSDAIIEQLVKIAHLNPEDTSEMDHHAQVLQGLVHREPAVDPASSRPYELLSRGAKVVMEGLKLVRQVSEILEDVRSPRPR